VNSTYPVTFVMDYEPRRSRLTTFFRYFLAIPHELLVVLWGIAAWFAIIGAWFALLFTGRWPEGLYRFVAGYLRYLSRVSAYIYLGTDVYPAFSGEDDPNYPVRVHIAPPLAQYSRVKVFFRGIYAILAMIIRWAMSVVVSFVAFVSWFAILITGKQPQSLQDALYFSLAYITRADALQYLITETYPPFGEPDGAPPSVAPQSPVS
jgi:hypothetical protein